MGFTDDITVGAGYGSGGKLVSEICTPQYEQLASRFLQTLHILQSVKKLYSFSFQEMCNLHRIRAIHLLARFCRFIRI